MRHKWWGTLNRGTLLCPVTVVSYTFLSICSLHPPPFQLYLHIFLSSQFSIWWSSCDLIPTKPTPAAQAVQDLSSPGPWGHLGQYASLALTMITSSSFVQRKSETKPKICLYCRINIIFSDPERIPSRTHHALFKSWRHLSSIIFHRKLHWLTTRLLTPSSKSKKNSCLNDLGHLIPHLQPAYPQGQTKLEVGPNWLKFE